MFSAIFFLNQKGEIIIYRLYRDDVSRNAADAFRMNVLSGRREQHLHPIKNVNNTTFIHIKFDNILLLAVTKQNVNANLVLEFLYRMIEIFKSYFGGVFNEEQVRSNFVLIYELLDEILDFGYPQNTAPDTLKLYITQSNNLLGDKNVTPGTDPSKITIQATGGISWRREGIKYRKNEMWIDVIESVNLLMSNKMDVLRADVAGQVMMKAQLSGMPECKFGLNDKVVLDKEQKASTKRRGGSGIEIDDVNFHQCVKLGRFDSDRTITFVPPDGDFELMKYRTTENINLPFKVLPIIQASRTKLEVKVTVKANFSSKLIAMHVVVKIPCPKNTATWRIQAVIGKAKYSAETSSIIWKIRRFPGDGDFHLSADIDLLATTANKGVWSRPPISMEFQVPGFTASGLMVRFLKVHEKSSYQTTKWVRYLTKGGQYETRI